MKHLLRKTIADKCPACHAPSYKACISMAPGQPAQGTQFNAPDNNVRDEIAYLEFQLFSTVHRLKELDPKHLLVTTITSVVEYNQLKGGIT